MKAKFLNIFLLLHLEMKNKNIESLKAILEHEELDFNFDKLDFVNINALEIARQFDSFECFKELLKHKTKHRLDDCYKFLFYGFQNKKFKSKLNCYFDEILKVPEFDVNFIYENDDRFGNYNEYTILDLALKNT